MAPEIIASQDDRVYLIVNSDDYDEKPIPHDTPAQVYNQETDELSTERELGSILAHSPYFEEVPAGNADTSEIIDRASPTV